MNYLSIHQSIYDRAVNDAATVALLGGSSSIFAKERLPNVAASTVLPWLMYSGGTTSGESGAQRDIVGSWWAYCAPHLGTAPLLNIASALETLYGHTNAHAISGGRTAVVFIGQTFIDSALGLNGLEIRVQYSQRG